MHLLICARIAWAVSVALVAWASWRLVVEARRGQRDAELYLLALGLGVGLACLHLLWRGL